MPTSKPPIAVLKLGGSLLTYAKLLPALERLRTRMTEFRMLLIPGGGAVANAIRQWQRIHALQDACSHWMAIRALTFNAQLLQSLDDRLRLVDDRTSAEQHWQSHPIAILNCEAYLLAEQPRQPLELPHHWDATSDSVAGWVAITWPADRFILLKSVDAPDDLTLAEASRAGLIDPQLPRWSQRLPQPAWVNLRRDDVVIRELACQDL